MYIYKVWKYWILSRHASKRQFRFVAFIATQTLLATQESVTHILENLCKSNEGARLVLNDKAAMELLTRCVDSLQTELQCLCSSVDWIRFLLEMFLKFCMLHPLSVFGNNHRHLTKRPAISSITTVYQCKSAVLYLPFFCQIHVHVWWTRILREFVSLGVRKERVYMTRRLGLGVGGIK